MRGNPWLSRNNSNSSIDGFEGSDFADLSSATRAESGRWGNSNLCGIGVTDSVVSRKDGCADVVIAD
jgi:hypothetical protein